LPIEWSDVYIHPYTHRPVKSKWFRCNYELVSWNHKFFNHRGRIYSKKVISSKFIYLIHPAEDWSHSIGNIISIHTKDEVKSKMLKSWFNESDFYSWKEKIQK